MSSIQIPTLQLTVNQMHLSDGLSTSIKCYETIMFGQVTHMLDAAAMQVRSSFKSFAFCNLSGSCSLITKENIRCSIYLGFMIEISATINLY